MVDLAEALKAERPGFAGTPRLDAPLGEKRGLAKRPFTMQGLQRLAGWSAAAAVAVLVVVLASRSDVAADRIALVLHHSKLAATPPFDAQGATEQLAATVRGLKANDEALTSRLAAVEHDMDDFTGSITKQIKAADANRHAEDGPSVVATAAASASMLAPADASRHVEDGPSVVATAAASASMLAPADIPSAAAPASVPVPMPAPGQTKAAEEAVLPPLPKTAFGVDIGSGLTLQALRLRWAALRTAHPQFFEGLEPIISVREVPHSTRIELRLVAGPIAQPGTAAELCAQLAALALYCQPTIYDGQHLALR